MPGPTWRSRVQQVGSSLDRCKEQIDRLEKMNIEKYQKEIFSNANTRVEVSIKTRKPEPRLDKNWSSLLSHESPSADLRVTKFQQKTSHRGHPHVPAKNSNLHRRQFAKSTASSRAKQHGHKLAGKQTPVKGSKDVVDSPMFDLIQHRFQNRTLQIFLREMQAALEAENILAATKILDDLLYVAQHLQSPEASKKVESPAIKYKEKKWDKPTHDQMDQIYEVTRLKSEASRLTSENKELKMHAEDLESRLESAETELTRREEDISNLKLIVSRLTSNNNDMLHILTSKASIENSMKKVEAENMKLSLELDMQKKRNDLLESRLKENESEAERLNHIIRDLKSSLKLEEGAAANRNFTFESTYDLDLSSNVSKSIDDGGSEADVDSAIGEGISESQQLSSAAHHHPSPKGSFTQSVILPPESFAKSVDLKMASNKSSNALTQLLPVPPIKNFEDSKFEAVPLPLSETRDDSDVSSSHADDKVSEKAQTEVKKAAVETMSRHFDTRVQSFLNHLRKGQKFQISLSSDFHPKNDQFSTMGDITGLSTDLDTTESRNLGSKITTDVAETIDLSHSSSNE